MRLSDKLFAVFYLFVPLIAATAQYRFDSWTTENGLPQNSVPAIFKLPNVFL